MVHRNQLLDDCFDIFFTVKDQFNDQSIGSKSGFGLTALGIDIRWRGDEAGSF